MGIQELISLSAQKASRIHLRLPPVNAPALIVRFSQELHIPQVLSKADSRLFVQLLVRMLDRCKGALHRSAVGGIMSDRAAAGV